MLVVCESCRRQYTVEGMDSGEQVRCVCSELITVPRARPRVVQILRCSSCGGTLREDATHCDYCGGRISLEERHLGDSCPECFARLLHGARFCRECGVEVRPMSIQAKPLASYCPRCEGELVLRVVPQGEYTECGSCGGIWLQVHEFQRVMDDRDGSSIGKYIAKRTRASGAEVRDNPVKYLPCPVCGTLMNRKDFFGCSLVVMDVCCKGHGYWFDTHELEKIISFINSGGLDKARRKQIDRVNDEIIRLKEQRERVGRGGY